MNNTVTDSRRAKAASPPWYRSPVPWLAGVALLLLASGIVLSLRSEFGTASSPPASRPPPPAAGTNAGSVEVPPADLYAQALQAVAAGQLPQASELLAQAQLLKEAELARLYQKRADVDWRMGQTERAIGWLKRALALRPEDAELLTGAGVLLYANGQYSAAEPLYQRALAVVRRTKGPEHIDVATGLNNLGALYVAQGKPADAIPLYTEALSIVQRQAGTDHAKIATTQNNLAYAYARQGQAAEAKQLYEQALGTLDKTLGPAHPTTARVRANYNELAEGAKEPTPPAQ